MDGSLFPSLTAGQKAKRTWLSAIPPEARESRELAMRRQLEEMDNGLLSVPPGTQKIFVISDSTGETAKLLISRLLVQFEDMQPLVRIFGHVGSPVRLAEVLKMANPGTLVFATLVDPMMVGWLNKLSRESNVKIVDVMTPLLNQLSAFLESESVGMPGMGTSQQSIDSLVSKDFMGMVEASQFAHDTSFGRNRRDWHRADVALVGIAKVGKIGIATALAQQGIKAVCVGIGLDEPVPAELNQMKTVVMLTMKDEELILRRENHIIELLRKDMGLIADREMASPGRVAKEQDLVKEVLRKHPAWIGPIDCSYKDEAEVASQILRTLREAGQQSVGGRRQDSKGAFPNLPALAPAVVPALAAAVALVAMHAFPARRATRPLASGERPPALAGGSLPPAGRSAAAAGANRLLYPVARPMANEQRLEMEMEMEQLVDVECRNEDPNMATAKDDKTVYLVSDGTGTTAQQLISGLLVQFRNMKPQVRLRGNVRTAEQVEAIVHQVSLSGPNALIFATLVDPSLLQVFKDVCSKFGVKYVDVMSPLIGSIEGFFSTAAVGVSGGAVPAREVVDVEFFNRVEAVQYAQQHVLGLNRKDWKDADVLLIGLSRVGKVSLAFYLAQYGIKAACADLRPGSVLPQELFDLDPNKVVVVEMQVNMLARKRRARAEEMTSKLMPLLFEPGYTNLVNIQNEAEFVRDLAKKNPAWIGPVDLTHLALEDRASAILRAKKEAQKESGTEVELGGYWHD